MVKLVRFLLVGGGGREHTIGEALVRSGAELYVVSRHRNPGLARLAKDYGIAKGTDVEKVLDYAEKFRNLPYVREIRPEEL